MSDPQNPFAAPMTDTPVVTVNEAPQLHGRMPGSVMLAIGCVGACVAFLLLVLLWVVALGDSVAIGVALLPALLGVLVLVGLVMRNRLAWQWGRITSIVGAVLGTLLVGLMIFFVLFGFLSGQLDEIELPDNAPFGQGVFALIMLIGVAMYAIPPALLWVEFLALGRPSARAYFGLYCPQCESRRAKAADFLFRHARCKDCQAVW